MFLSSSSSCPTLQYRVVLVSLNQPHKRSIVSVFQLMEFSGTIPRLYQFDSSDRTFLKKTR